MSETYIMSCSLALILERYANRETAVSRAEELNKIYPVSPRSLDTEAYVLPFSHFCESNGFNPDDFSHLKVIG